MQKPHRTYVCIDEAVGAQQQRCRVVLESALLQAASAYCQPTAERMHDIILRKKRLPGSTSINLFRKNSWRNMQVRFGGAGSAGLPGFMPTALLQALKVADPWPWNSRGNNKPHRKHERKLWQRRSGNSTKSSHLPDPSSKSWCAAELQEIVPTETDILLPWWW